MDELGFNKIAAAILATALGVMALREVPHFFMHTDGPDVPVYSVGAIEVAAGDEAVEDLPFPQQSWVDAMDATAGAKVFKKCQSCHNVDPAGTNGTGPGLYGVVGRLAGAHQGFNYSEGMASAGYDWSYEELDGFLTKPAAHISGTKMAFIGLKKPEDRAAVIEYLREESGSTVPKPEAVAAPAPTEAVVEAGETDASVPTDTSVVDENGAPVETVIENPTVDPTSADTHGEETEHVTPESPEADQEATPDAH